MATVQVTLLTNLLKTIFSTEPEDKDDKWPLNRIMSLHVLQPKFVKGHLNASFQSDHQLEFASLYKSTSINPFQYTPQTDQAVVMWAHKEMEEECNKLNFRIIETQCKKTTTNIKGIGWINIMDDVAIPTANICGMQLAVVDTSAEKPILYQLAWKSLKFIENKMFVQCFL